MTNYLKTLEVEHMREKAADDIRTRPAGDRPATPLRGQRHDTVRERPTPSHPGPERTLAGPSPKERMRQTVIKGKQDRRIDVRQRPTDIKGRRATLSVQEPAAAPPKPQERMKQKAKAEMQAHRAGAGRVPATFGVAKAG